MRKHIRKAAVATVLAAGTALGGIALTGTAQAAPASPATGFIDGIKATTNDWGDESLRLNAKSNAVRVWQSVLYADGARYTDEDGDLHTFGKGRINGKFDAVTRSATEDWQTTHDIDDVTGRADSDTFSVADDNLGSENATTHIVRYNGDDHDVNFRRFQVSATNGFYQVQVRGVWQWARY